MISNTTSDPNQRSQTFSTLFINHNWISELRSAFQSLIYRNNIASGCCDGTAKSREKLWIIRSLLVCCSEKVLNLSMHECSCVRLWQKLNTQTKLFNFENIPLILKIIFIITIVKGLMPEWVISNLHFPKHSFPNTVWILTYNY